MKKQFVWIAAVLLTALACQKKEPILPDQPQPETTPAPQSENAFDSLLKVEFRHDNGTPTSPGERAALVSFYQQLESTGNLDWPVSDPASDPCVDSWTGIYCEAGQVITFERKPVGNTSRFQRNG